MHSATSGYTSGYPLHCVDVHAHKRDSVYTCRRTHANGAELVVIDTTPRSESTALAAA